MIFYLDKKEEFFYKNENIGIIIYNKELKKATIFKFSDKKELYKFNLIELFSLENIEKKEIFSSYFLKTNKLFFKSRYEGPMNKIFSFLGGYVDNEIEHFSENINFLKLCDVDEIKNIKLKVISILLNKEDFKNEIQNKENKHYYGLWDIKEDSISSSFIFKNLIQTQMCFPDFGDSELKNGSVFVKLEIIEERELI